MSLNGIITMTTMSERGVMLRRLEPCYVVAVHMVFVISQCERVVGHLDRWLREGAPAAITLWSVSARFH